ncbi:MAG: IS66 family insertion sequence element accessory protein TnpB [Granulosicoccaceae bacterium]
MILLTHETRIVLSVVPVDFRRGIDGFVALHQNTQALQPRDVSVIVFINRARTMIRVLSYDVNGYWLMAKRLSRGKFTGWPDGQRALPPTSARELRIILGGATWTAPENKPHTSSTTVDSLQVKNPATGDGSSAEFVNLSESDLDALLDRRKLLGMVRSSEKLRDLVPATDEACSSAAVSDKRNTTQGAKKNRYKPKKKPPIH